MTNERKFTLIVLAGFAVCLFLLLQRCGTGICPPVKITSSTTSATTKKYDNNTHKIPSPPPALAETIIVEIPTIVDTLAILKSFYAQNIYKDTIQNDSVSAFVTDTVSKNKIIGRGFSYKWLKPVETITTITNTVVIDSTIKPKMSISVGPFLGATTIGDKAGFGVSGTLHTKKLTHYTVRYDLLQRRIDIGAEITLRFRK